MKNYILRVARDLLVSVAVRRVGCPPPTSNGPVGGFSVRHSPAHQVFTRRPTAPPTDARTGRAARPAVRRDARYPSAPHENVLGTTTQSLLFSCTRARFLLLEALEELCTRCIPASAFPATCRAGAPRVDVLRTVVLRRAHPLVEACLPPLRLGSRGVGRAVLSSRAHAAPPPTRSTSHRLLSTHARPAA